MVSPFSRLLIMICGLLFTPVAMAMLIVTANDSGTFIDGFVTSGEEEAGYTNSGAITFTTLKTSDSSSVLGSADVTGGSSAATADLSLSILDNGDGYSIFSNLAVTATVDLGDKSEEEEVASGGAASAETFMDLFFDLDSNYSFTAGTIATDAGASANAEFFADLFSVDDDVFLFSALLMDDIATLSFTGLLTPGSYQLSLGAFADVEGMTGNEFASGDFAFDLTEVSAVPLPPTLWLLVSGLFALAVTGMARSKRDAQYQ